MLRRSLVILLIIIINPCTKTDAQEKDTLLLTSGQVLIGDVKGGSLGEISIDESVLKLIDIKLYRIKRMNTYRRFKIEMLDKQIYYGMMKADERDGWVKMLLDNGDTVRAPIMEINTIIAFEKKFFQQLNGNLSLGFSYTKSSDLGQINLNSTVQYNTELFQYMVTASAIESIDSGSLSRDREDASLYFDYNFRPTWFIATKASYQRNLELSIARRYQFLGGVGKKIIVEKTVQLLGVTGMTFNTEKSTSGEASGLLLEVPAVLRFDFFKFRHPDIQINSTHSFYFSITQKGRIRYDSNTSFSWQLIRNFYITFSPYTSYDNQPPQGNNTFDYGLAFSLTFKF